MVTLFNELYTKEMHESFEAFKNFKVPPMDELEEETLALLKHLKPAEVPIEDLQDISLGVPFEDSPRIPEPHSLSR